MKYHEFFRYFLPSADGDHFGMQMFLTLKAMRCEWPCDKENASILITRDKKRCTIRVRSGDKYLKAVADYTRPISFEDNYPDLVFRGIEFGNYRDYSEELTHIFTPTGKEGVKRLVPVKGYVKFPNDNVIEQELSELRLEAVAAAFDHAAISFFKDEEPDMTPVAHVFTADEIHHVPDAGTRRVNAGRLKRLRPAPRPL